MIFSPLAVLIAIICQLSRAEYRDLHILRTGGGLATVRDHFAIAERARVRYGSIGNNVAVPERERRADTAQGTGLPLTNEASDQYYYTVVDIGTPPQSFNMIVDTGSGDMIVASASCASCQGAGTLYDYSLSSTAFNNTSRGFKTITYGQGSVNGSVFEDTISLGPYYEFSVDFLQITEVSQGLIPSPVSGILGLAFHGVAQVAGIPLWESLIGTGRTPAPLMAFWLSRFVGSMSATKEQPGGSFTFGGVNSSLFSGEIEFLDITDTENTFWSLNLSDITVQGKAVNIVSATKTAVIDTGTSAIGGPPADVKAIWAVIPGSSLLEDGSGFYEFPCATSMNVSLSFGRQIWAIDPADLNLGPTTQNRCLGGIFQLTTTGPRGWVIGTPFLKNVYTVLRYEPPSVGFAQLSTFARGTGTPNPVPVPSIGTPTGEGAHSATAAAATSSSSAVAAPGDPASSSHSSAQVGPIIGAVAGVVVVILAFVGVFLCKRRRASTPKESRPPVSVVVKNAAEARPSLQPPPASPTMLSLAAMRREQAAAVPRYDHRHTTPDMLVQTRQGLQLSPGVGNVSGVNRGDPAASSPNLSSTAAQDPDIMQELLSLRQELHEVRRLAAERENTDAPPSYDQDG